MFSHLGSNHVDTRHHGVLAFHMMISSLLMFSLFGPTLTYSIPWCLLVFLSMMCCECPAVSYLDTFWTTLSHYILSNNDHFNHMDSTALLFQYIPTHDSNFHYCSAIWKLSMLSQWSPIISLAVPSLWSYTFQLWNPSLFKWYYFSASEAMAQVISSLLLFRKINQTQNDCSAKPKSFEVLNIWCFYCSLNPLDFTPSGPPGVFWKPGICLQCSNVWFAADSVCLQDLETQFSVLTPFWRILDTLLAALISASTRMLVISKYNGECMSCKEWRTFLSCTLAFWQYDRSLRPIHGRPISHAF